MLVGGVASSWFAPALSVTMSDDAANRGATVPLHTHRIRSGGGGGGENDDADER